MCVSRQLKLMPPSQCAREGVDDLGIFLLEGSLAGVGKFSSEEEILAAAHALPRR
jgi:hypothetical protein